jgi:hypothetical protein
MVNECGVQLGVAAPRPARPGQHWQAAKADSGGAPLF